MSERLVVIGGGAAGSSVAAKARRSRPDLEVHMFERGPHVSYMSCPTPYYIAGRIADAGRLVARTPEQFERSGVRVHLGTAITAIDFARGIVRAEHGQGARGERGHGESAGGESWPFDYLAYASGASSLVPRIPGIEHEAVVTLKDLKDAVRIKEAIRARGARSAIILGAGLIAMEMAETFRALGLETRILHHADRPLRRLTPSFSETIRKELEKQGVEYLPETEAIAIEPACGEAQPAGALRSPGTAEGRACGARVHTSDGRAFEADLVLAALGIRPNVDLAREAGIALGSSGAIATDDRMRATVSGDSGRAPAAGRVYAAGDCAEAWHRILRKPVFFPFGDVANRQGRVAGSNIAGQEARFPGVVGSWCCKIFDLEVAHSGLCDEEAQAAGIDMISAQVTASTRARAYPGSQPVQLRILAERTTGRLLGAQAIGTEGAVSRVNVVAAGLHRGMTLEELAQIDLCYAPPYAPAWDPLHLAASEALKSS
ncbi:MAG: FAD-dependent oxidoreductase [Candidatus Eisenbacteria bacterium]|nr:FAD-dependent oxidoreductase [Candidatus Eisenbacteria bacterium]